MPEPVTIHVCVTCRDAGDPDSPLRPGARLLQGLERATAEQGLALDIVAVECLSVCKRPCTIGFSAAGKWTYVYGDLAPETSVDTILAGAALYGATPDGLIPWKQRPDALKKGVVARIPPFPIRAAGAESRS